MVDLKNIIEGCKKNDVTAQRLLYERYANHLRSICMRYIVDDQEVKDVVQDSFIKIISKINQYKEKGTFEGWITRILINTAFKYLKKNKKKQYFSDSDDSNYIISEDETHLIQTSDDYDNISDTYDSIEQLNFSKEELMDVIMSIPDSYRVVFNLFHIEEYSHEEITQMLEIRPGTSRTRLLRARNLIREKLVKRAKELQSSKISQK